MKIYNLAVALVVAAALSGCSKKECPPQRPDVTPLPLQINVGVGDISSVAVGSKSGVVTSTTFKNESKINVIMVAQELNRIATITEYPVSAQFICATTEDANGKVIDWKWSPVDVDPPKVTINTAAVLAHYPAVLPSPSSLSLDKRTINVSLLSEMPYGDIGDLNFNAIKMNIEAIKADVWFAKGDDDYMTGTGNHVTALLAPITNLAQNSSDITMKHALAMLVVHIKMEAGNPEINSTISELSIENAVRAGNSVTGPLKQGSFDIATNTFIPNSQLINYKRPMSGFGQGTYFGLLAYPALIVNNGDVVIKCSVGAAGYTYQVPATTWLSGCVYLYELTLTAAGGVLDSGVRIIDWPDSTTVPVVVD